MTSTAERDEFDEALEAVVASLPEHVREMLEELPVIVEDEPPEWALKELGIVARRGESDLCGLHSGIPLTEQGRVFGDMPAPQSIYVFRGPLLRLAGGELAALKQEIKITLLHEIGHHYGMTEDDLEALGYQ